MSYKNKIVSTVATGFAIVSFSAFASAQHDNTTTNQSPDSVQKQERHQRRGFGKRGEDGFGKEGRGGKHHGNRMGMRELHELNLTDAQKQQVREIMSSRKADSDNFQELRQLAQAKRDGTITPEQTEKLKTFKQQMRQNAEQTHRQILAILTAEQRTQLEQLKQQKEEIGDTLESVPRIGERLRRAAKTVKDAIAAAVLPGALVNELGFKYIGYVDGHNVPMLVAALEEAKKIDGGPVIVHALTTKGKGFPNPEKHYYAYHATGPYDLKTGAFPKSKKPAPKTYTQIFGETMCELMERDEKIVALTAAMPDGTGVDKILEKFPERAFDVGIAEQHAVTFCAGMACEGLKPVAAIYSTFLQRGFDQILHDVCLQNLNVTFAMDRAGIVGADGPTHHGLLDIAYLRGYPNIVLMAPKDEAEMRDMLLTAIEHDAPAAIRYPRGNGFGVDITDAPKQIELGKAEILRDGGDGEIAILAYGSMVYPAMEAARSLEKDGIEAMVVNARFVKPLDAELILALAQTKRVILTVEEAYLAGGFGSAVMELLEENAMLDRVKVVRMGVPDRIITHGDAKLLLAKYGLDADGIYTRIRETIEILEQRRTGRKRLKAVR